MIDIYMKEHGHTIPVIMGGIVNEYFLGMPQQACKLGKTFRAGEDSNNTHLYVRLRD